MARWVIKIILPVNQCLGTWLCNVDVRIKPQDRSSLHKCLLYKGMSDSHKMCCSAIENCCENIMVLFICVCYDSLYKYVYTQVKHAYIWNDLFHLWKQFLPIEILSLHFIHKIQAQKISQSLTICCHSHLIHKKMLNNNVCFFFCNRHSLNYNIDRKEHFTKCV